MYVGLTGTDHTECTASNVRTRRSASQTEHGSYELRPTISTRWRWTLTFATPPVPCLVAYKIRRIDLLWHRLSSYTSCAAHARFRFGSTSPPVRSNMESASTESPSLREWVRALITAAEGGP